MPLAIKTESIEFTQIDLDDLHRLAASEPIDADSMAIPEGALPPPHVAVRALSQLELGTPALWCVPFLIVSKPRRVVLGGCGFKTAPSHGVVEIGYRVAERERGRGVATLAVDRLLQIAASSGLVQEVVAHILPDNTASSRVVARLGFSMGSSIVDTDGETVVRWAWRAAA